MSYVIDVARGTSKCLKNPIDFALYVSLFPQLIAGPIVRYGLISQDINNRKNNIEQFSNGAVRFVYGLFKKVVIADSVGLIADTCFSLDINNISTTSAWLGLLAYTLQIYFDFSAYSDMAIGLGHLFGFHFPENFNRPYSAISITDFWRRWHITLSTWFRDYVYIPLGGSRVSTVRMYGNLILVFFITGLWHGANWTFIIWGAYHGTLLIGERLSRQRNLNHSSSKFYRRVLTILLVMLGWVIFRSENLAEAQAFYSAMFRLTDIEIPTSVMLVMTPKSILILIGALSVFFLSPNFSGSQIIVYSRSRLAYIFRFSLLFLGLPYIAVQIASSTYSPFLYFQF